MKKKSKDSRKQRKNKDKKSKKGSSVNHIKETISLTRTNRDRQSEAGSYTTTHCLVQTVKLMKYGVTN